MEANCGYDLYWYGMYRGTYDLIAPDSFAHPAKMAPTLCYRILKHLQELGLLKEGDTILDPMAGTGMTNICAGALGYSSISVELEEKFVGFQEQNKGYAERRFYKELDWRIIQGDSRKLSELLKGQGLKSVMSPPYEEAKGSKHDSPRFREMSGEKHLYEIYGTTEGQIGNLKDTPLKSITSPPYGIDKTSGGLNTKSPRSNKDQAGRSPKSPSQAGAKEGYGKSKGQIGTLRDIPLKAITSPPYGAISTSQQSSKNEIQRRIDAG